MRRVIVLEFVTLDGVIQAGGGPEEDTSGGAVTSTGSSGVGAGGGSAEDCATAGTLPHSIVATSTPQTIRRPGRTHAPRMMSVTFVIPRTDRPVE